MYLFGKAKAVAIQEEREPLIHIWILLFRIFTRLLTLGDDS